jgi:hypothetical protein
MAQVAQMVKTDPQFRDQFREDPVGAAQAAGVNLGDDDISALSSADFAALSDERMIEAIAQFGIGGG